MPKVLGTLLPVSAIGSFSKGKQFVDWLVASKQNAWQFLPLHPASRSPYNGFGIGLNTDYVNLPQDLSDDPEFINANRDWLDDYALFMALAEHFRTTNWTRWPKHLAQYQTELAPRIEFHKWAQAYTFRQYQQLQNYAKERNIKLIGDAPFYLSWKSPLVWAHRKAFLLNKKGTPEFVSGVISSGYFPRQVWHHPLYNYHHLTEIKKLWKIRLRYCADLYDWLRLDSAISFYTYNKIDPSNPANDETTQGPGNKILSPIIRYTKKLKIKMFLENVTDYDQGPMQELAKKYRVPGVAIYALNPEKFVLGQFDQQTIYYSSNHDCPTLTEFTHGKTNARETRKFLWENCPQLILPMQDWLLSGRRINYPGTAESKNWRYRIDVNKLKAP